MLFEKKKNTTLNRQFNSPIWTKCPVQHGKCHCTAVSRNSQAKRRRSDPETIGFCTEINYDYDKNTLNTKRYHSEPVNYTQTMWDENEISQTKCNLLAMNEYGFYVPKKTHRKLHAM